MKSPRFVPLHFFLLLLLIQSCAPEIYPESKLISKASWRTEHIAPGVVWKYHRFDSLFDGRQSITVFEVDLGKFSPVVAHLDSGFFLTSTRALEAGAIAAINGSFFDTRRGGSVVFFQQDGVVVTPSRDAPRAYRDNAGFAIDKSGHVSIITKPSGGWKKSSDYKTILSSGPLLVLNGERVAQVQEKFNTNRHPRTAIGLGKNDRLIAVVVDGRSSEAYGMSTEELATVMTVLGCHTAMNLDGGGSSTAWIKGQPFDGVVNFPSDNKKFDHEGERAVANCILFIRK